MAGERHGPLLNDHEPVREAGQALGKQVIVELAARAPDFLEEGMPLKDTFRADGLSSCPMDRLQPYVKIVLVKLLALIPESGVKRRASCVKWFELFDLAENFADQVAQHRRFFEPQYRTVLWASQFPGQEEEFVSQPSECEGLPRFLQAVPLKRGDKIVSESNDFQVQSVGRKRCSWYLSKREVFAQLTDSGFHASAAVVEMPDAGWSQMHVGHPGAIHVTPQSEQCGLSFLSRNESSRHHETTGRRPAVRTMLELCHLPLPVHGFIS